jgi:acetylornithine deacetylase/succinyl-diaminopimelate desuccinylase-like protein
MTEGDGHIALDDPRRGPQGPPGPAVDEALGVIELLATSIGPRRPCSEAEKRAAGALVGWLRERGVEARTEEFTGYASFGYPYGLLFGASLAGGLLQRAPRAAPRRTGAALAALSAAIASAEGDLRWTPLSDALSTQPSVNVVGHVPSAGPTRRRVCLCAHLDTTSCGVLFHPAVVPHLAKLLQIPAASTLVLAAGPLVMRVPGGRALHAAALAGMAIASAFVAERELRGVDVPGANDNASGCGVAMQLAAECAAAPLDHTEVDVLITSCEEAGMLGAQAYAHRHTLRAAETTFLNLDTVGGDVPLTYILREGSATMNRPASERLVRLLEDIAQRRPDLGLVPARTTPGLPTDATPMRARGWEAVTLLAQDGNRIPNYHWPSDTYENVEPRTVGKALETGRELLVALDTEVRRR